MNPRIIFQIVCGRRSITLFSDLRVLRKGPKMKVWSFPAPSLVKALTSVNAFAMEHPRAKWTITVDETDKPLT